MKLEIYSMYDAKLNSYGRPFYLLNEAQAIRAMVDLMIDGDSDPARHPEDFILFKLGNFDDSNAVITADTPKIICKLHELKIANILDGGNGAPKVNQND